VADLIRVPCALSIEWRSKTVTTDPPRYTPHTEWSLCVTLAAPTPVRVAVFISDGAQTFWGLEPNEPAAETRVTAKFFPANWNKSDEVGITLGWQRIAVTDAALKEDPRRAVTLLAPASVTTGEIFGVVELPAHDVRLASLAVAEEDTERRRLDRWRIKPGLAESLPRLALPLTSGKQNGIISAHS
jgi:hypothetical protein